MELTDEEIGELYDVLTDAMSDAWDGIDGRSDEARDLVYSLGRKVQDEAKKRKLWWAR